MIGKHRQFAGVRLKIVLFICLLPLSSCAETAEPGTVRVGYYENEVFQEGAAEGTVKTGYAYEYYRKLSEYTGWNYEYVYGSYSELYQMLPDHRIDLLAGLAWKPRQPSGDWAGRTPGPSRSSP